MPPQDKPKRQSKPRRPRSREGGRRAYEEAERRVAEARAGNAIELDLQIDGLTKIPPLSALTALQSLDLSGTQVSDLTPLSDLTNLFELELGESPVTDLAPLVGLTRLEELGLYETRVQDLEPLSKLRALRRLYLGKTKVSDLGPIANLTELRELYLFKTSVSDISALAGLTSLQELSVSDTQVSDLAPLARLTSLIDSSRSNEDQSLNYEGCPIADPQVLSFAKLDNSERTERTINYLRKQQGLPPYHPDKIAEKSLPPDALEAIEGVPAPFDFEQTASGTITVAASDTNIPAFPFATSREDHAQRLEACKALAADLTNALLERNYDNVRQEYLSYLQRYRERLPQSADGGNMLLADSMARSLGKLFAAEAEILPAGFATELHTLLEQHIAACVYYPGIGAFNRDVRDGKPSRPFPLQAAEAFARTVQAHTPQVFEPPVAAALSEAKATPPPLPAIPRDTPPPSPQTLTPPPNPGGETDPRKSREFATASTANRLWDKVHAAASMTTVATGVGAAAYELAPHAAELIHWLAEVLASVAL